MHKHINVDFTFIIEVCISVCTYLHIYINALMYIYEYENLEPLTKLNANYQLFLYSLSYAYLYSSNVLRFCYPIGTRNINIKCLSFSFSV